MDPKSCKAGEPKKLPDDMLMEIFSRLPAKSLLRFGCLSKEWYVILTSFYRKKLPSAMVGFFLYGFRGGFTKPIYIGLNNCCCYNNSNSIIRVGVDVADLSFLPALELYIISCCNGLVLCCGEMRYLLYVCNPVTRQWAKIPIPPYRSLAIMVLVFDPRLSNNHYTIINITITFTDVKETAEAHIYSSETGKWVANRYRYSPSCGGMFDLLKVGRDIVYMNGDVHLLDFRNKCVWTIDIEEKILYKTYLPPKFQATAADGGIERSTRLGKCSGRLHFGAATKDGRLSVWVLEDHDRKHLWVPKHDIDLQGQLQFLAFHPYMDVVFLAVGGQLLCYHFVTGVSTLVARPEVGNFKPDLFVYYAYSPCYLEEIGNLN